VRDRPPTPPRDSFSGSFDHLLPRPEKIDAVSRNWVAAYQVWSLDTLLMTTNIRFEICPNDVLRDRTLGGSSRSQEFKFPVALSPSLRLVFIMGTVIQMISQEEFVANELFDTGCPFNPVYQRLLRQLAVPTYLPEIGCDEPKITSSTHAVPHEACHEWIRCCFSPGEGYMTVLRGEGPPSPLTIFSSWVLSIYEKADSKPESRFHLIANSSLRLNSSASHTLCFHPTEPVVVICMMSITAMWRFKKKGKFHLANVIGSD
jgi:hypothetical protein